MSGQSGCRCSCSHEEAVAATAPSASCGRAFAAVKPAEPQTLRARPADCAKRVRGSEQAAMLATANQNCVSRQWIHDWMDSLRAAIAKTRHAILRSTRVSRRRGRNLAASQRPGRQAQPSVVSRNRTFTEATKGKRLCAQVTCFHQRASRPIRQAGCGRNPRRSSLMSLDAAI